MYKLYVPDYYKTDNLIKAENAPLCYRRSRRLVVDYHLPRLSSDHVGLNEQKSSSRNGEPK